MKNDYHKGSRQHLIASFRVAIDGIIAVVKEERNIKIHILIGTIAIILGILLRISTVEWVGTIIVIGMVIGTELINSAIEKIVDVIMPDYDIRAKRIKDVSAGAVLVVAISALVVGGMIFIPKLYILYQSFLRSTRA